MTREVLVPFLSCCRDWTRNDIIACIYRVSWNQSTDRGGGSHQKSAYNGVIVYVISTAVSGSVCILYIGTFSCIEVERQSPPCMGSWHVSGQPTPIYKGYMPPSNMLSHWLSVSGKIPVKVSAGDKHTCGVKVDQTLSCWGKTRVAPRGLFQQLSVGAHHTCALRREGSAVCWGDNISGSTSKVPKNTTFVQVS